MANKKNKPVQVKASTAAGLKPPVKEDRGYLFTWLLAAAALILTLLISTELMDPVLMNRHLFLDGYLVFFLLLVVFYGKKIQYNFPPLIKYIFLAGLFYAVWNITATLNAVNPVEGIFETSRNFFHLLLLAAILITASQHKEAVSVICRIFCFIALFHSITGFCQFYDIGFTGLPGNVKAIPFGFNANRNLYGSFLVLCIPFVLIIFARSEGFWKIFSGISLTATITAVFISQTRSAWLAVTGTILVVIFLSFLFCKSDKRKLVMKLATVLIAAACFCTLIIFTGKENYWAEALKERVTSISSILQNPNDSNAEVATAADNVAERLKYWRKSISMVKDHPLLGVGRSNWKLNVEKYSYADVRSWASGDIVPDFPHNVYLYIAAETGLPGLALFLLFWVLIIVAGFKILKKATDEQQKMRTIILLGGFVAFAIDAFFSFPDSRAEHMFCLLLMGGFILADYAGLVPATSGETTKKGLGKSIFIVAGILIIIFNGIIGVKKIQYEKHYNIARAYELDKNWQGILDEAAEAKSSWVNVSPKTMPVENLEIVAFKNLKKYPEAIKAAKTALQYNPVLAAAYNNLGTVYQESNQPDSAYRNYEKALKIAPGFLVPMKNMTMIAFSWKNYDTCLALFKKIDINSDSIFIKVMQNIVYENYQQKNFQKCAAIISGNKLTKQQWFDSVYVIADSLSRKGR